MPEREPPLVIDGYCGLGGWAEGFLAEGYAVVGFDIERHDYGTGGYPGQLVLQDIRTLHGSQFRNATCLVFSPPCQEFSYMAMPWKRAKQIAAGLRGDGEFPEGYTGSRTIAELTALFDACFRIQREASEAAGRYIPMVVENVKGAQPWVGKAKANYGSFYLWGDVESVGGRIVAAHQVQFGAASVKAYRAQKIEGYSDPRGNGGKTSHLTCQAENDRRMEEGQKAYACGNCGGAHAWVDCPEIEHGHGRGSKNNGGSWFNIGSPGQKETNRNPVHELAGRKVPMNFHEYEKTGKPGRSFQSAAVESAGVSARKAASAAIAKIPLDLARYIARVFKPERKEQVA